MSGQTVPIEQARPSIEAANEEMGGKGLRVLAFAARFIDDADLPAATADPMSFSTDLSFVGMAGIIDPLRKEAKGAVETALRAGIDVRMITGDHAVTAQAIGETLGLGPGAISGAELQSLTDEELARRLPELHVFGRVSPEDKLRLARLMQEQGLIVAMTGDAVNDAAALKQADIGVAMGITGSDVSKEAADMILVDDNFATIVAAVEEGRAIFANIRKFLRYLLSSNIGEVLTMFFGVLLADQLGLTPDGSGLVLPLLATQILWINLVTDGPPALALGLDPPDEGLMSQPPRPPDEGVLTPRMWRGIALVGIVMMVGTLYVLDAALPGGYVEGTGTLPYAQTMAFTTLMLFQIFNVFNARSDDRSAFHRLFTNQWLWLAVAGSVAMQAAVVYLPFLQQAFGTVALSAGDWLRAVAVASSVLWLRELSKLVPQAAR